MTVRKKVQAGDTLAIPARTWNDLIDIADAWSEGRISALTADGVSGKNPSVAMAKNTTGSALKRHSIVTTTGSIATPSTHETSFRHRVQMLASAPIETGTSIAVTLSKVPANGMVACAMAGAVPCQILMNDPDHTLCRAVAGVTDHLESHKAGNYPILYVENPTGISWGYALLPGFGTSETQLTEFVRFQLAEDFTGATANANAIEDSWPSGFLSGTDALVISDPSNQYNQLTNWRDQAKTADRGVAVYDPSFPPSGRWIVLDFDYEPYAKHITFQLTSGLQASAQANVIGYWEGRDPDPLSNGLTVHDSLGKYGNPTDWRGQAQTGDQGHARYNEDLQRYDIVELIFEPQAKFVLATLSDDMAGSAAAFVNAFWAGKDPGAVITVHDTLGIYAYNDREKTGLAAGDSCIANWDEDSARYVIIDARQKSKDGTTISPGGGGGKYAYVTQEIGAATGAPGARVLGEGTVDVYDREDLLSPATVADANCVNGFSIAIPAGRWLWVAPYGGDWAVVSEDCTGAATVEQPGVSAPV